MKTLFKTLGVLGLFFFLVDVGWGQTTTYWRNTNSSGANWHSAIWEVSTNNGSTWSTSASWPQSTNSGSVWDVVIIRNALVNFNPNNTNTYYVCYIDIQSSGSLDIKTGSAPASTKNKLTVSKNVSSGIGSFSVQSGCTFTNNSTFTINSNVNAEITIGSTFTNSTGKTFSVKGTLTNNSSNFSNNGTMTVDGTFKNYVNLLANGTISMNAGSIYEHCFTTTAGTIPTATWVASSTCKISGYTTNTSTPSGIGQSFSAFTWNCGSQEGNISLLGLTSSLTDFNVTSTGTGSIYLNPSDAAADITMNINGSFTLSGGTLDLCKSDAFATYLNCYGSINLLGGILTNTGIYPSGINPVKMNVPQEMTVGNSTITGNLYFYVTNGTTLQFSNSTSVLYSTSSGVSFYLDPGAGLNIKHPYGISTGSSGCIQVAGDRSFDASAIYNYCGDTVQITGDGLPTTITGELYISNSNGVKLSNNYNFDNVNLGLTVNNNGKLICNGYYIDGVGKFLLSSGCHIVICSQNGITTTTTDGNIRNSGTKQFEQDAIYEYAGVVTQTTGNALPSTVYKLIINNSAGVNLANDVTVSSVMLAGSDLNLVNGEFIIDNKNLTINGTLSRTNGTFNSNDNSTITIGGTGDLGSSMVFTSNSDYLKTLTINRTGTSALGSGLRIYSSDGTNGTLTLTNGTFDILGNTLSFIGGNTPIIRTSGTITATTNSTILFDEASKSASPFTLPDGTFTNGELYNLTIDRVSSLSLGGDLRINGNLALTSGEFVLNSNLLYLNGTVSGSGTGTIYGDDLASIAITGTGALGTLYFSPDHQVLAQLVMDRTSNGSATLGSNLNLDWSALDLGKLTLTNGTLIVGANTLTFTNGNIPIERTNGTITTTSSSNLVFGEVGKPGGDPFTIPAGTFSSTPTVNSFSINRINSLTLSQDLNVNGTLNLTSGLLYSRNGVTDYIITLGESTSSIGTLNCADVNASHIVGKFRRYISTSTTNYIFPVGTATYYNGINLTYTSGPSQGGTLTSNFIIGDPGNKTVQVLTDASTTPNYQVDKYSNYGYWNISNSGVAGTYGINVNADGFPGISTVDTSRAQLRIIKRQDSNYDWEIQGSHSSATGTQGCMVIKRTGLTSFSDFAIASNHINNSFDGPLPVYLSSFNSNINVRDVKLSWVTSAELNNAGFDVERKTADGSWSKVGYVKGSGTKNTPTTYNFNDMRLNSGKYNYRLKQIDNNGNFEYHNLDGTVEVGVPKSYEISQNYPNPFNPTTKIDFALPYNSKVNIIIYDMTGREVKTLVNDTRAAGYYTVELNASSLSSGTYFYRIIANNGTKDYINTKKMILVK